MGLVKREDKLSLTIKISRDLHDEIDRIRKEAKEISAQYDPAEVVERALRKDIARTRKQIKAHKEIGAKARAE